MNNFEKVDTLGYPVFADDVRKISLTEKIFISTINQYAFCMAARDAKFKSALQQSDILLPDGIGMVAAVKLLEGKKVKKIAGSDIHLFLLKELNSTAGSCFYLGSSERTLQKIKSKIKKEYPKVRVEHFSPPFKSTFTKDENMQMINAINSFNPDVLFIGMTAPKQENWAYANKELVNAKLICSIGAAFDFYAGVIKRPGKFWIKLRLEWLIRLIKEPKRLWKRYLYYGPIFLWTILKVKLKKDSQKSKFEVEKQ